MTIEEWAANDFRIGIFPVLHLGKHEWTAGEEDRMTWLPNKGEGCTFSSFNSYNEALEAVLKFCETYKIKRKK